MNLHLYISIPLHDRKEFLTSIVWVNKINSLLIMWNKCMTVIGLAYSLKINELNQSSQAGVTFFQLNSC